MRPGLQPITQCGRVMADRLKLRPTRACTILDAKKQYNKSKRSPRGHRCANQLPLEPTHRPW